MKCSAQVYVHNSLEAVDLYCRAFGARISFEMKNTDETEYEHCELSVNGERVLAISEANEPYDVSIIHQMKLQTMTFNAYELGSVEAVQNAYNVLREGGVVLEPIHEAPWCKCCATVIDRYGVCWWIAI